MKPILVACVVLLSSQVCAQSLWSPQRPMSPLFADTTARTVGDVLTVIISEKQTIKNKEDTELSKDSSINAALTDFNILENAFGILPTLAGNQSRDLQGRVQYDKEGTLQTRISVLVIDVMPNGNMLVEGRRRIVMDKETKTIRFTGIVRPFDVSTFNTVLSESVANAAIAYEGVGPLSATANRGWLSELLDFVWPF